MNIKNIILGLFISVLSASVTSQPVAYWRFENNWNDDMGNYNGTGYGGPSFSTSPKIEGTYSASFNATNARMETNSAIDMSSGGWTLNLGFHSYNESGGYQLIWSNRDGNAGKGHALFYDRTNNRVVLRSDDGTSEGNAYSANNSVNINSFHWIQVRWMDINAANVKIFVNGSASGTDTVSIAGAGRNGIITFGDYTSPAATLWDNVDNASLYDRALTNSQLTDIYTNRASNYTITFPVDNTFKPKITYFSYLTNRVTPTDPDPPDPPVESDIIDILGRGVNAYGVVSNTNLVPNYTDADWDSIALHFDHVRLVLYGFADNGSGNVINPSVLTYLTSMVDECNERGMVAVIDYHSPAWTGVSGYTTDTRAEYLAHWGQIANTLSAYDTTEVVYELVNEPHYSITLEQWNTLAADAVSAIRAYDTEKYVMISPGYWAGVKGLPYLELPDDDKLIVSLHYYNPRTLTHQCAAWGDWLPAEGVYLSETWCGTPWYAIQPFMDEITKDFAYVDTWLAANGNPPLHIGEIGVYNLADDSTARAPYLNYLTRWIESKGWTWCLWDYDADFGCFADGSYIPVIRDALFVDPMPEPLPYDSTTIYEADFTGTTDGWGCFDSDGTTSTSEATLSVSGGELVVTVNTPGSSTSDIRIGHTVDLVQGKIYRLSYTIRSASNRSTLPVRAGTRMFSQEEYNVGIDGRTTVISRYYSDVNHSGAKILFDIGGSSSTFYISNLKWEELTIADPLDDFTIIYYKDFEDLPLGPITEADLETYLGTSNSETESGLCSIVTMPLNGDANNKALLMKFPPNATGQRYMWELYFSGQPKELYASQNIKYGKDDLSKWSNTAGGKNFNFRTNPVTTNVAPTTNEGFAVLPMFSHASMITHYFYYHNRGGYGNNSTYPYRNGSGVDIDPGNKQHFNPGSWFDLTMRVKIPATTTSATGITEEFLDGYPIYQYNDVQFFENATVGAKGIELLEFTYFQGGSGTTFYQDDTAYYYTDNWAVWVPDDNPTGLNTADEVINTPYPVKNEPYRYSTLINTETTFTNSEYGSPYSPQVTEAWLIDAGAGHTVNLTINSMSLDAVAATWGFPEDIVRIYDGNISGSDLIGRYINNLGTNFPAVGQTLTSTGRYMYVIFESNVTDGTGGDGFQMTVTFN